MCPFANAVEVSLRSVLEGNKLFPATQSRCHLSRLHPHQCMLHLNDQSRSHRFQIIRLSSPLIKNPTQPVLADLPSHLFQHCSLAYEACNLGAPASKEAHTLHSMPSLDDLASCGDIVFDSQQGAMPEQPSHGDNPPLPAPVNVIGPLKNLPCLFMTVKPKSHASNQAHSLPAREHIAHQPHKPFALQHLMPPTVHDIGQGLKPLSSYDFACKKRQSCLLNNSKMPSPERRRNSAPAVFSKANLKCMLSLASSKQDRPNLAQDALLTPSEGCQLLHVEFHSSPKPHTLSHLLFRPGLLLLLPLPPLEIPK